MKFSEEYDRKHKLLKNYKNKQPRYTPSLTNGQWMLFALIADAGWLTDLIFIVAYFITYGFHEEIPLFAAVNVLALIATALIQVGYMYVIHLSFLGEKEQQTRRQKNLGFGVPSVGASAAFACGIAQAVCSAVYVAEGWILLLFAAAGAFLCFVGCFVIFRSFQRVSEEER